MIVAAWFRIKLRDARADAGRFGEIQRGSLHGCDLARRDQGLVRGRVSSGRQPQLVVEHVATAGEVEVGVAGQIDGCGPVGGRFIIQAQFVVIGERVSQFHGHVARVTLLPVLAQVSELDGGAPLAGRKRLRLPDALVKYAVNVVRPVIGGQFVFHTIQSESRAGDAIGHPPDDGRRSPEPFEVLLKCVGAQDDVRSDPVPIRHPQFGQDRTVSHDLR